MSHDEMISEERGMFLPTGVAVALKAKVGDKVLSMVLSEDSPQIVRMARERLALSIAEEMQRQSHE